MKERATHQSSDRNERRGEVRGGGEERREER
jgi:hypothetical protein